MQKFLWMSMVAALLLTGAALAQGPKQLTEEVKAKARANQAQAERDRERRAETRHEGEHHRDDRVREKHKGDHDRDDRIHKVSDHPPGWSHGRKTGWGNCDVPPGQAKKQGCHPYHTRNEHRVKTTPKPAVVRRPTAEVHAHASVDAKAH